MMRQRQIWIFVMGLALLPLAVAAQVAQEKNQARTSTVKTSSTKEPSPTVKNLVGVWRLVEFEGTIDGQPVPRLNAGRLAYDASGQVSLHMMKLDRPKFASDKKRQSTNDEAKVAFDGYVAYFGTYRVNEAEGVVIHRIEGSLFPNEIGKESIRFYELSGDRLILRVTSLADGKILPKSSSTAYVVWERVKQKGDND
jgi:hypothetical protein